MDRSKPVTLGGIDFPTQYEALAFLKAMLRKYQPGEVVSREDALILADALARHPEAAHKIGTGIAHFSVRNADFGSRCFWVTRRDGTLERFSYRSCV